MSNLDWKSIGNELRGRLKTYKRTNDVRGAGVTLYSGDGVVRLSGLMGSRNGELIEFESGGYGIVMNLEE
ncbi:MAG: F0F1 ATP synthase subunit alpha, partial [Clostridia bacterium]|nr:F0F1 ATP synthase subunit alpha [Clostridia bacterium]